MSESQKHNGSQHDIQSPLTDSTADGVLTSEHAIGQQRHQQQQMAADSVLPHGVNSRFNNPLPSRSDHGADEAAQSISPAGAAAEIAGHANVDTQTTSSPSRRSNHTTTGSQLPLEVSTNGEELPSPPNGTPSSSSDNPNKMQENVSLGHEQLSKILRQCSIRSGGTTSSADGGTSTGTADTTFEEDAKSNEYRDLDTDIWEEWEEWYREGPKN